MVLEDMPHKVGERGWRRVPDHAELLTVVRPVELAGYRKTLKAGSLPQREPPILPSFGPGRDDDAFARNARACGGNRPNGPIQGIGDWHGIVEYLRTLVGPFVPGFLGIKEVLLDIIDHDLARYDYYTH